MKKIETSRRIEKVQAGLMHVPAGKFEVVSVDGDLDF
jgi:hypothetical protein